MSGWHAGALVPISIAVLVGGGLAALFGAAGESSGLAPIAPYLERILSFSVAQAAVSTLASLVLGAALALALARRRFAGRQLLIAGLGAASVMPAIVVVFSVIAVYGRGGWLAEGLRAAGLPARFSLYGWPGILIAHVFLNAPFAARVLLNALALVPAEQWRLAEMLGFTPREVARHLDWPALKAEAAGLASLIFLLCFTSFAIVLSLGGGGGRATLEVAIFEALRTDLDFGRAAWLALIQIGICGGVALLLHRAVARVPAAHTLRAAVLRPDRQDRGLRRLDAAVLLIAGLLLGPPSIGLLASLPHVAAILDRDVGRALLTSLGVAGTSAAMACLMALALASAARRARLAGQHESLARIYDVTPALMLAVPPFALTAGLYLVIRRVAEPAFAGLLLLPAMNALAALPFAYRFVAGPTMRAGERYGRLADLLGLSGRTRIAIVDWPLVRRPLAAAFAMAMALSFGDFGIIALFGGRELRTLPYLLFERLGAYRLEEASAIGLLLVAVSFALAYASARWSDAAR